MKRFSHIGVIALLLAVNWGAVLAAAPCPRAQGHTCCHAKPHAHGHGPAQAPAHQGMAAGNMEGMAALSDDAGNGKALDQPVESCAHCMSHSGSPLTAVVASGAQGQSGREMSAAPPTLKTLAAHPFSFAPPVVSRQHAPPGASNSRHLLISVFLI